MPPPEMLQRYNALVPDFAERTLAMVEQQATSRQRNEAKVIDAKIKHEGQGQWMAFILALMFLVLGGFVIYLHEVGLGTTILGVDFVTILGMFVYRQRREAVRASQGLPPQNINLPQ
jgi:uncharacterized membrane protein